MHKSVVRLNPLPNDEILDVTKFKAFAEDILNVARITISLFDVVENTGEKGGKCWLPAFSSFSHSVFQSFLLQDH